MVIMQEIKIGVVASMLMLEIVAYYSKQNKDLFDVLEDIYNKYGYYIEKGESIVLKGIEGKEKIKEKMDSLRNTVITEIEGVKVLKTRDYEKSFKDNFLCLSTVSLICFGTRASGYFPYCRYGIPGKFKGIPAFRYGGYGRYGCRCLYERRFCLGRRFI